MPVVREYARFLAQVTSELRLSGAACTLGRLWPIYDDVTFGFMRRLAAEYGLGEGDGPDEATVTDDVTVFRFLGYDVCHSLDASAYEGASIVFDMNAPVLRKELANVYDVVLNGGTMEHVFHIPNFLSNISKMLKLHGCVIHMVPIHNQVDHGYYQFSPCLFFDYYQENGFTIEKSVVYRFAGKPDDGSPWQIWGEPFLNAYPRSIQDGQLDQAIYMYVFIARKTPSSLNDQIPNQRTFANQWQIAASQQQAPDQAALVRLIMEMKIALVRKDEQIANLKLSKA
ncbi:MAG: hypothetical protein H7840_12890 [Alphaproteobacteria bacterium]